MRCFNLQPAMNAFMATTFVGVIIVVLLVIFLRRRYPGNREIQGGGAGCGLLVVCVVAYLLAQQAQANYSRSCEDDDDYIIERTVTVGTATVLSPTIADSPTSTAMASP